MASLADKTGKTEQECQRIVASAFAVMTREVAAGQNIVLEGLGVLRRKPVPGRRGRNPRTGQRVTIPATWDVSFHFSNDFQDTISKT